MQCANLLFQLVDQFIQEEEGQTPFAGQTIVLDKFLAWEKEKRPDTFDEVIYTSSIICEPFSR